MPDSLVDGRKGLCWCVVHSGLLRPRDNPRT